MVRFRIFTYALAAGIAGVLFLVPGQVFADCPDAFLINSGRLDSVDLSGRWRYQALPAAQAANPAPARPDFGDDGWGQTAVPGTVEAIIPRTQFRNNDWIVWYRCNITLQGAPPKGYGLYLGLMRHADAVYFNGRRVGQTGEVGGSAIDIEKRRLYSLPASFWQQGQNVIAVQLRAVTPYGGLYDAPAIVEEQSVRRSLILSDVPNIVFCSIYILVAAFFGVFYVFFWHQLENLFFALFSLFLGLYNLIRTGLRYWFFSDFEFSWQMELLLLFTLPFLFLEFLTHLVNGRRGVVQKMIYAGYAVLLLATLVFGQNPDAWYPLVYTNLAFLVVVIVLVYVIFRRNYAEHRDKLRYLLMGFLSIIPFMIHDILDTLELIESPRIVVFGFVIFLGFAAMQLSNSILDLYRDMKEQELGLRQLEKSKARSIFNISTEFQRILLGFRDGLGGLRGDGGKRAKPARKKKDGRSVRGGDGTDQQIRTSTINLENLVNDSNLLYLLEADEYNERRVRFSLRRLCEQVLERAVIATTQTKKRVHAELPPEEEEITGDPDLIATALYHLVENALLYSLGKVEVGVENRRGELRMIVRDEGPGLPGDQQHAVFQKFVRGPDAEDSGIAGSGIGLAIVELIAGYLDGNVRLEGGAGFFSTFVFSVPLAAAREVGA